MPAEVADSRDALTFDGTAQARDEASWCPVPPFHARQDVLLKYLQPYFNIHNAKGTCTTEHFMQKRIFIEMLDPGTGGLKPRGLRQLRLLNNRWQTLAPQPPISEAQKPMR